MFKTTKQLERELKTWTNTFPDSEPEEVKEKLDKLTEENENLKQKLNQPSGDELLNNLLNEENKKLRERVEKLEKLLSEQKQSVIILPK